MKKKLWYAVKSGRKTGLFTSWDDCKLQVIGYPGASYKGFFTKEEAMEFLEDVADKKVKALKDELRVAVYVDGSYIPTIPDTFSFGVVFIHHGTVETYAEKIIDAEEAQMRNVAGEIHGAVFAMGKCLEKGISEINLYYDYVGIEKWCTGEWKANKRGTKALREYYELIKGQLTVHFHKVASHTGVMYNEMADQLAKNALLE